MKQLKWKQKNKNADFMTFFLGTSGASLLGNMLAGKGTRVKSQGQGEIELEEGTIRAGADWIFNATSSFNYF